MKGRLLLDVCRGFRQVSPLVLQKSIAKQQLREDLRGPHELSSMIEATRADGGVMDI